MATLFKLAVRTVFKLAQVALIPPNIIRHNQKIAEDFFKKKRSGLK
jgi:hypothetical protein